MIHPTAILHPKAKVDPSVQVGPYAVIDSNVQVGPDCVLGPYVHLTGCTTVGAGNRFHAGCVIGDAPQDLKYKGEPTRLRIGESNTFREHATVHASNSAEEETILGSHNFLMAHSHIGHNTVIGNHVIIANGVQISGHVRIDDRAFISGNCLVHQFVRVGQLAFMQGGSAISQDLPPFTVALEINSLCGLNIVGLRRAGFSAAQRLELKRLYHMLFRRNGPLRPALERARAEFQGESARCLIDFVATATRGVCRHSSRRRDSPASAGGEEESV